MQEGITLQITKSKKLKLDFELLHRIAEAAELSPDSLNHQIRRLIKNLGLELVPDDN